MTTSKMPEPVAWRLKDTDVDSPLEWVLYQSGDFYFGVKPQEAISRLEPLYTAQALRDVLEQAAELCNSGWVGRGDDFAAAIRAMIGQIK